MAMIPRASIDALTKSLNMLSEATRAVVRTKLSTIEYSDITDLREKVIAELDPILEAATDYAAAYAASTYDQIREQATGDSLGAESHSGRDPKATEGAIRAFIQSVVDGDYSYFENDLAERADYEIKRAAAESILHNARRDPLKPRYARVPTGAETCSFCLMLASRGFVYHSKESAGALNHWHPNCDCRIIPGFDGMKVQGYNPDELYAQWKGREEYIVPEKKIFNWSLQDKNKARAFKGYLDFDKSNGNELINRIFEYAGSHDPIYRNTNDYGEIYYHDAIIEGPNGKKAKVKLCWIRRFGEEKLRLTSAYVDE